MNYKYKKGQVFGKRLNVPKYVMKQIYASSLSFTDYIKYELEDKIPLSCVWGEDREIVEKFGLEKAKELDWELLNTDLYYSRDLILKIDSNVDDVNKELYDRVVNLINPKDYSSKMRRIYSDRFFYIDDQDKDVYKVNFNNGRVSLIELIKNWELYKDKDLSFCLVKDKDNKYNITNVDVKNIMLNYMDLMKMLVDKTDIYEFINIVSDLKTEEERKDYIKKVTDNILKSTISDRGHLLLGKEFTNEEYKEIFKYSSMGDYLKMFSYTSWHVRDILKELKELPEDYVFNMPFPFYVLLSGSVLSFVGIYGLKNVVDFDIECGHFFSNNNCKMLYLMYDMYLNYASNENDSNKIIFTKNHYDENGKYVDNPYTKDEFYEAMRRMIVYGPSDYNYIDKAPDYRDMIGEFRRRNTELFVSETAPEKLQALFYTKSLTPQLIVEHPEYVQYLKGKDLGSCFKIRQVKVDGSSALYSYENLYSFINNKFGFDETIDFIKEYSDVLEVIYNLNILDIFKYQANLSIDDDYSKVCAKFNEVLKKLIIEKGISYPKIIPQSFIDSNPNLFLNSDAPKELQDVFYNRTITADFILSNLLYKDFLKNIDLELLYKYMPVKVKIDNYSSFEINIITALKQSFGEEKSFDLLLSYGKYLEKIFDLNNLREIVYNPNMSKEELLDQLDVCILSSVINDGIKYDDNISEHFKNNNPNLFLDINVSDDIKNKFYNREFTLNDFSDDPDLIEKFGDANVICGFDVSLSWMISLFDNETNSKIANLNRLKVISEYLKINDVTLKQCFREYVTEFRNSIDFEKIEYIFEVLIRLSMSNSNEIFTFRKELATQILNSSNPLEILSKIEDVFIKNNTPTVGKIYSCFEILHPDFKGFNFDNSKVSPFLKKFSNKNKKVLVFSDLIKASFGSNNRSVNSYLNNIEIGYALYQDIKTGVVKFDELDTSQRCELITFSNHLITLYNNTYSGKKDLYFSSGDVLVDIFEISKKLSPDGTIDYNLADRVIRMFCGFSGISTLKQAKDYINKKVKTADLRNRAASNSDMVLEQGDFVKGIGDIKYLGNILQNGSLSKEYLGSSACSDSTPLDTDVSMILNSEGSIDDKIKGTVANDYGPIWFVLKNDDRFVITRPSNAVFDSKRDISKMEAFYTGVLGEGHYGIRTGFASSEINYIVMENFDPRVGLEIVMNGFYIPVADRKGKIIFTVQDYDKLREKMQGLSHFGENDYKFSDNLVTDETEYLASLISESNYEVEMKREKINKIIEKSLEELGLKLKNTIDGDLTEGYVELIDTGSTGRGTNKPGDGDFDFMMRLDRSILLNSTKLNELKGILLRNLGKIENSLITGSGDFRLKNVLIDSDTEVDIDITFTEKTDKVSYSTDMSLQDRLTSIYRCDSKKYNYVVANILLAKQILKEALVYKPNRGEVPQGGLGGVGIENWILQNGGSFIDAAKSFVEVAEGKSFEEFKKAYQIWDFGDNHLAERRGQYVHDNFVSNNMSEEGYNKMVQVLLDYLKNGYVIQVDDESKEMISSV